MSNFLEMITSMQSPFNMIVLIVLIVCVAKVVAEVIRQVRKYASHREELEFKRELVDRGMTAQEVEQVVRAKSDSDKTA